MFSSSRIYRVNNIFALLDCANIGEAVQKLDTLLGEQKFTPCAAQESSKTGFVAPFPERHKAYVYSAGDFIIGAVKNQSKSVPVSFINEQINAKKEEYFAQNGSEPSRKMKADWKEEISTALLPNIIPTSKVTRFCIDVKSNVIFVDSSSSGKSEDILALLRKVIGSLPALPYFDAHKLHGLLQCYGKSQDLPDAFKLGSKIKFKSADEEQASSTFKNVLITADDVQSQFEDKLCVQVQIEHTDKLTFELKDDSSIGSIKFADAIYSDISEEDALPSQIVIAFSLLRDTLNLIDARTEEK